MESVITKEVLQALAIANGLNLPDKRLDDVLRQYQAYLNLVSQLESLSLEREAEPAFVFSPAGPAGAADVG